jgi:PKD repeat protein
MKPLSLAPKLVVLAAFPLWAAVSASALGAAMSIVFCPPAHAYRSAQPSLRARWDQFLAAEGIGWEVHWEKSQLAPDIVRPPLEARLSGWSQDHARATQGFFRERAALFGLRPGTDELEVASERSHEGVAHLRMRQSYRGIPVLGGEYMVSVRSSGVPSLIAGRIYPWLEVETTPVITASDAAEVAARAQRQPLDRYDVATRLAIDPTNTGGRLVYEVRLMGRDFHESWQFIIDARDGAVLAKNEQVAHAIGRANVFLDDPSDPLNLRATFPIADPAPGQPATLSGPNAFIVDESGPEVTGVYYPPLGQWDFKYMPDLDPPPSENDGPFDQANTYWHADHYIRQYLGALGWGGMSQPVQISIRGVPVGGCSGFAAETFNNHEVSIYTCGGDNCKASDVVYHELTHAVWFDLGLGYGAPGLEYTGALNEGYAFFLSCAANNDPCSNEYFTTNCSSGYGELNTPTSILNYSLVPQWMSQGYINAAYGIGHLWAATLWDIRAGQNGAPGLGAVTDQIAFESLYYLPTHPPSLQVAASAVVQADFDHHGGTHITAIRSFFQGRGFNIAQVTAAIGGPATIYAGQTQNFPASPQYGEPPYTYQWTVTKYSQGLSEVDDLGNVPQVTLTAGSYLAFEIHLIVTDHSNVSAEATRWIQVCQADPPGSGPFNAQIAGGPKPGGGPGEYEYNAVLSGGACWDTLNYKWELRCRDPGCQNVVIGTLPTVTFTTQRNFDLTLTVTGNEHDTETITVTIPGMPEVGIVGPPSILFENTERYNAYVQGGQPPFTYRWTVDCYGPQCGNVVTSPSDCAGGPGTCVDIVGPGVPFTLYLEVTANGMQPDVAEKPVEVDYGGGGMAGGSYLRASQPRGGRSVELAVGVPSESRVSVRAFDVSGRRVAEFFNGSMSGGNHQLTWNTAGVVPGVYFIRASIAGASFAKTVVVTR